MMTCRPGVLSMGIGRFVPASLLAAVLACGCAGGGGGIIAFNPGGAARTAYTGTVVGPDDKPVAKATVTAWMGERTYRDIRGFVREVAKCTADADGAWRLAAPSAGDEATVIFVATRPGLGIGWAYADRRKPQEPLTIRMAAPSTLAGTVTDEKDAPVPAATVRLTLRPVGDREGPGWLDMQGADDLLTRRTDAQGRFAFNDVPADRNGLFSVRAAGHGRLDTMVSSSNDGISPPRNDIRLVLPPAGRIEVQAVEKDSGKPVPSVALMAENWRAILPVPGQAVKGSPGTFVFEDLPPGRYEIGVADPAGGLPDWTAPRFRVSAEAGQTVKDVKIELVRGGVAEIKLTSSADGQPVRNGHVGISTEEGRGWFNLGIGGGTTRVRLAPGEYNIRYASAEGFASTRSNTKFTVENDKTVQVEISLTPVPKYEGVVIDPAGSPIAGASVCILPDRGYVKAGDDGKFSIGKDLSRWPTRSGFLLLARLPGADLAGEARVGKPGQVGQVQLAPALTITGRVTDPEGRPIRGADVNLLAGRWDGEDLPSMGRVRTDRDGAYRIGALPAGQDYTVAVRATRRMPVDVHVAPADPAAAVQAPTAVLPPAFRDVPAPAIRLVPLPRIPDADAIWGAVTMDRRGHIWFGITMDEKLDQPSAHLVEYDPATDKAVDRGDAITQLKRAGVYREGEGQLKVHSRVVEADDGYLYFASMDEKGEDMAKEVLPKWGSHLWRIRPDGKDWEHLLTAPEALITLDAGKRYVYALGYYRHMLYQYDTVTGKSRSVEVGAIDGHVSRNIFTDARDHVYVPRIAPDPAGGHPICSLVEYDTSLKEVAATRLTHYFRDRAFNAHGIIGFTKLPDGRIAFVSHAGQLTMVAPSADGPADVTPLGWLHPEGEAYAGSLHSDETGRYLYSCVHNGWYGRYDWLTYDLQTCSATVAPFRVTDPRDMSLDGSLLYGSNTRDAAGNFYIVGRVSRGHRQGNDPVVLQVKPANAP
ncbi:MAG TPA: carboxypeptidase-like regulatory domain-containing protein [Phycisphaerae bacterium]|nr:carboxypeptidase-like regulatory domain-containing protein [Phycisphaerae bacterium]